MSIVMNCEEMKKKGEMLKACHLNELVRGSETGLIEEMTSMVRCGSVRLDLHRVERIDAAGVAALISLYRTACEAGNSFRITNLTPHVAEVLALVGVDRILVSHNARQFSPASSKLVESAA
jgi:anti-anti-sigma factor